MKPADGAEVTGIKNRLLSMHWGGHALVSLYISVLSGIVIGLQYSAHEPFYSTATIELVVPFGSFWRALHYYSSQAFFLLLLCHLSAILWKNDYSYSRSAWIRLTASVPVGLLLLFTGYVLRGDATGEAAGNGCYDAFAGFVGHDYETSIYGFTTLSPSAESWDQLDDREVLCLIANYDETKKTGSAQNTGI